MHNKKDFIILAINDTQSTIRAIDVKASILLAVAISPLSSIGKIWNHFTIGLASYPDCYTPVLGAVFTILWTLILVSLGRTISAVDNPSEHIVDSSLLKGSLYGGGLFKLNLLDTLYNRKGLKSTKDVATLIDDYPNDEDEENKELVFEHLKLIYIREIKLNRFNFAMKSSFYWLMTGLIVYILSKLG